MLTIAGSGIFRRRPLSQREQHDSQLGDVPDVPASRRAVSLQPAGGDRPLRHHRLEGGGGAPLLQEDRQDAEQGDAWSGRLCLRQAVHEQTRFHLLQAGAVVQVRLYFCACHFLSKKGNVHLFSSSLPRLDKCHETSRIFPRTEQTFASARSFGFIF